MRSWRGAGKVAIVTGEGGQSRRMQDVTCCSGVCFANQVFWLVLLLLLLLRGASTWCDRSDHLAVKSDDLIVCNHTQSDRSDPILSDPIAREETQIT
jgi:hypothetical protein